MSICQYVDMILPISHILREKALEECNVLINIKPRGCIMSNTSSNTQLAMDRISGAPGLTTLDDTRRVLIITIDNAYL